MAGTSHGFRSFTRICIAAALAGAGLAAYYGYKQFKKKAKDQERKEEVTGIPFINYLIDYYLKELSLLGLHASYDAKITKNLTPTGTCC